MSLNRLGELVDALGGLINLGSKIKSFASRVFLSRDTLLINNKSSYEFIDVGVNAINSHAYTAGAVHGESLETINAYPAEEIDTKVLDYLKTSNVPISRFGTLNYIPPNILGGIQSINATNLAGSPVELEADGTLTAAIPFTNGEKVDYFTSYLTNAVSYIDAPLAVPRPNVTNTGMYLNREGWEYKSIFGGNNGGFFASIYNPSLNEHKVIFTKTNGTIDGTKHETFDVVSPVGSLYEKGVEGIPRFNNNWIVSRICSHYYVENGEPKVLVWVEDPLAATWSNGTFRANEIYTGIIINGFLELTQVTGITKTLVDGTVLSNQTDILPWDKAFAPSTNAQAAFSIFDPTSIKVVNNAPNFQFNPIILKHPIESGKFLFVMFSFLMYTNIYNNTNCNTYIFRSIEFDLNNKTSKDSNPTDRGVLYVPSDWGGNYPLCTLNSYRHSHSTFLTNVMPYSRPINTYQDGNRLVFCKGRIWQFDRSFAFVYKNYAGSWYDFFKIAEHNASVINVRLVDFLSPDRYLLTDNLRHIAQLNKEWSLVLGRAYNASGTMASSGHGGLPLVVRHNDGVRPYTAPKVDSPDNWLMPAPEPLMPRLHITGYSRSVDIYHRLTRLCTARLNNGDIYHRCVQLAEFNIGLMPTTLVPNPSTGFTDGPESLVMPASVMESIRQQARSYIDNEEGVGAVREIYVEFVHCDLIYSGLKDLVHVNVALFGSIRKSYIFTTTTTKNVNQGIHTITNVVLQTNIKQTMLVSTTGANTTTPFFYSETVQFSHGTTVFQRTVHNNETVTLMGFNSKYILRSTSDISTRLKLRYDNVLDIWTIVNNASGHASSGGSTFYNDKVEGLCNIYGDRNTNSDWGSKMVGSSWYIDFAGMKGNLNQAQIAPGRAFAVMTVKKPVSFDLTIPDELPVIINGQQKFIEPQTFNIHDVCIRNPLLAGRYYLYLTYSEEGDLKVVTDPLLVKDTTTTIRIGYVEFDELGLTNSQLIKVTKIGKYRLLDSPLTDYELPGETPNFTTGHPSS